MNLSPSSYPSPGLILDQATPTPRHCSRRLGSMPQVSASDQEQISDSSSPWWCPPNMPSEVLGLPVRLSVRLFVRFFVRLCPRCSYLVNSLSLYLSIDYLERKFSEPFAWVDLRYRGLLARV